MAYKVKKKNIGGFFLLVVLILLGYLFLWLKKERPIIKEKIHTQVPKEEKKKIKLTLNERISIKRIKKNYEADIDRYAKELELPAHYFKALALLECSGKLPSHSRLEKHVFQQLKDVRDSIKTDYFGITKTQIEYADDDALKNLASSWGPFQVMGYQVIPMGLNVSDLRGDKATYWGMVWIKKRYGRYLKKKRYKDAFHIHNTGRPYPIIGKPLTYNSHYIPNGLKYMECF